MEGLLFLFLFCTIIGLIDYVKKSNTAKNANSLAAIADDLSKNNVNLISQNSSFCHACGKTLKTNSSFCSNCGAKQPINPFTGEQVVNQVANFCRKCGTPVKADDSFCSICGTKLNDSDCQQVPQQPINPFTGEQVVNPFVNAQFPNISSVQNLLPEKTLDNTVQIAEQQPIPVDSKTDNAVVNSDNCNVEKIKLTFKTAISRYWHASYEGRCSLKEYWKCVLVFLTLGFLLAIPFRILDDRSEVIAMIMFFYSFAFFIPNLALVCRRSHDLNMSGLFHLLWLIISLFVPYVGLPLLGMFLGILFVIPGNSGSNKFGPPSEY